MKWQTKEQLSKLLVDLVEHASNTGSQGEVALAEYLYSLLKDKKYFQEHPAYLQLHPVPDGRSLLTAFVKQGESKETVVLLSHFDVVEVQDYGDLIDLAFCPVQLTRELKKRSEQLPKAVREDLESNEWLFGRGTMDMKAGISVQLAMLERAMSGEFNGNLLFVSVPDEEVNSAGMLSAIPVLEELKQRYGLTYKACVNSEPMFAKYPNDQNHYLYTGSIGKALVSFYCSGIETHVGEPFSGLNATLILTEINRLMELNASFCEQIGDEVTPPPTSLMMRDLKQEYSVQIPHASVSMYNLLLMQRPFSEVHEKLIDVAKEAAVNAERFYQEQVQRYHKLIPFTPIDRKINVFTYKELLEKAIGQYGDQEVERRINKLLADRGAEDDRDFSTKLVGELVRICKHDSPMIVLLYSPPYYPAVSSKENELIQRTVERVVTHAQKEYQINLKQQHYFPGLCDLSFVQLQDQRQSVTRLTTNMPLYGSHFSLPLKEMKSLNIPVLNIGPIGRDPHKWTERLHIPYAFAIYPKLLAFSIQSIFNEDV